MAVISVPPWNPMPGVGLDPSWQAALHMAARFGSDFGRELNFTYGPLGFLALPTLYYSSTWALAFVFTRLIHAGVSILVLKSARASFGLLPALVCSYVAVRLLIVLDAAEVAALLVLLVAMGTLRSPGVPTRWLLAAGGGFSALLLLVKTTPGLVAFALTLVVAWLSGRSRWRCSLTVVVSFGGSIVVLWLLSGNTPGDIPDWAMASAHISSAYSSAMGVEEPGRALDHRLLVPAVAIVVAMGWWGSRRWSRHRRLLAAALMGIFLFAAFKRGFVRHDAHADGFFALLPAAAVAMPCSSRQALAGLAALVAVFLSVTDHGFRTVLSPAVSLNAISSDLSYLASASRRTERMAAARAAQRAVYGLDAATLSALEARTVHVDPWEASVAWAYPELRWQPLPVFQSYVAYDAHLDEINAGAVRSVGGPERILRQGPNAIDLRNPDFESPATIRAMLCHFRQVHAGAQWQVLARSGDRCGATRRLASVTARPGGIVDVPTPPGPNLLVFAHIHGLDEGIVHRLASTLFKSAETYMVTGEGRRIRLVPGTASGPLLMSAPDLGYDPRFGFASPIRQFRLEQVRGVRSGILTVEFSAVPLLQETPETPASD